MLIIGEAITLIIGMNLSGEESSEWLSIKNYSILVLDITLGILILLFLSFLNQVGHYSRLLIIFLVILIISHFYRGIEYFIHIHDRFCFNVPLFIINGVKLALSSLCVLIAYKIEFRIN